MKWTEKYGLRLCARLIACLSPRRCACNLCGIWTGFPHLSAWPIGSLRSHVCLKIMHIAWAHIFALRFCYTFIYAHIAWPYVQTCSASHWTNRQRVRLVIQATCTHIFASPTFILAAFAVQPFSHSLFLGFSNHWIRIETQTTVFSWAHGQQWHMDSSVHIWHPVCARGLEARCTINLHYICTTPPLFWKKVKCKRAIRTANHLTAIKPHATHWLPHIFLSHTVWNYLFLVC